MYKFLVNLIEKLPMNYIMNAMLAIILALLVNYVIISIITRLKKPKDEEIMKRIEVDWSVKNVVATSMKTGRRHSLDGSKINNHKPKLSRRERKQKR